MYTGLSADSEPYGPVFQADQARNGPENGEPGAVPGANEDSQPRFEHHDESAPMFQAAQGNGGTDHAMIPEWYLEYSQPSLQHREAVSNPRTSVDTDLPLNGTRNAAERLEAVASCNEQPSDLRIRSSHSLTIGDEVGASVGNVYTWSAYYRLVDGFRALLRQEVAILEEQSDRLFAQLEKRVAERNEKIAEMFDGIQCVLAESEAEIRNIRIAMGLPSAEDVSEPAGQ